MCHDAGEPSMREVAEFSPTMGAQMPMRRSVQASILVLGTSEEMIWETGKKHQIQVNSSERDN